MGYGIRWLFALLALSVVAVAQQPVERTARPTGLIKKPSHSKAAPISGGPVTEAEAKATFDHVTRALRGLTDRNFSPRASGLGNSSKPVSRLQVIEEMNRLVLSAKPYFKISPIPIYYNPAQITVKAGTPDRAIIESLIRQGFVARVSPLATATKDSLTIPEFGDAVGIFVARAADLTHLPSPKYSPYLNGEFGG